MNEHVPRLQAEEMQPELAEFLAPRIQRLGYLGEFFQCTAHQPAALLKFLEFTEELKHALPSHLTELIALTIAMLMDNAYERVQHERLCEELGFSPEWLNAVLSLDATDDGQVLTHTERSVRQLAISVVKRGGRNTTHEFQAVIDAVGVQPAIAVLMLISRYMSHAAMVNTLDLPPPALAVARGRFRKPD
jgi:alkylhydroperoxidase family enzyme